MSGHNCPSSRVSSPPDPRHPPIPLRGVYEKKQKVRGEAGPHDNWLTGAVAKGMVDGVARTRRGDKVMA